MNCDRSKAKSGMTLVELLVIISACSIILTTSATLMHRVMQAQKQSQAFFDTERSAARLSAQFRRDVHRATAAMIDADAEENQPFLQLQLPGGETIEYRRAGGEVLRSLSREGAAVSREQFEFPPYAQLTIHEATAPRRLILSIATERNAPPRDERGRTLGPYAMMVSLQVEACLNRNRGVADEETQP